MFAQKDPEGIEWRIPFQDGNRGDILNDIGLDTRVALYFCFKRDVCVCEFNASQMRDMGVQLEP